MGITEVSRNEEPLASFCPTGVDRDPCFDQQMSGDLSWTAHGATRWNPGVQFSV